MSPSSPKGRIYTIGHSTRSLEEFLDILGYYGITLVVDVRRWPKSRKHPWFSRNSLEARLAEAGVGYVWLGEQLGGYRRLPEGVEGYAQCFASRGFQAYAYHITYSREARRAVEMIEGWASGGEIIAIMCSERLPWRCHRKIIADVLVLRGWEVVHIVDKGVVERHTPSRCARPAGDGWIVYV